MSYKKLHRSSTEKVVSGVCGGIGEYFDLDPTLVRVGYVGLSIFSGGGPGLVLYIILMFVIPEA